MLWIKSLHIVFVTAWFAGLFYLPRIYVNLAQIEPTSEHEFNRLIGMAQRLMRFTHILAVPALGLGIWLWLEWGFSGCWLYAKLFCVLLVLGYHHSCMYLLQQFEQKNNRHSALWFRIYNELPVVLLLTIVIFVVVKPL